MGFMKLEGQRVTLVPLDEDHIIELYECSRSEEVWEYLPIRVSTLEEMKLFVSRTLEAKELGEEFPYIVYDNHLKKIVGTTRYLRISEPHKTINVGWTWYSREVWRTKVNTETKYLLFKQAFERWHARRIELITTPVHTRSQQAIERLGAIREGILRKKYNNTDYVVFSIIDQDWDEVKKKLEGYLEEEGDVV